MNPSRVTFPSGLPDAVIVELDDGGLRVVRTTDAHRARDIDEARAAVEAGTPEPRPSWHERAVRIVAGLLGVLARNAPPLIEPGQGMRVRVYAGGPGDDNGPPLRPSSVHAAVARRGLALAAERDPGRWRSALDDDEAIGRLARAVARDLARFHRTVRRLLDPAAGAWQRLDDGQPVAPWEVVEVDLDDGLTLWLDDEGAAWLEGTGEAGRELAAKMRASSTARADGWRAAVPLVEGERDAGELWRAWYDPDAEPTPCPWAHFLALALWLDEVGPAWGRGRRHLPALAAPGVQGVLDLAGARRVRDRVYRPARIGADDVEFRLDEGTPKATADAVRAALRPETLEIGVYAYLVFHHVVVRLHERMMVGDVPWDTVPVLDLPTGKKLAAAVGAGASGAIGDEVEAALHLLSAYEARDGRGGRARLWDTPQRVPHGGGRPAAWLVTPGEILRPTFTAQQPKRDPWRRLVCLPDELPDRSIVARSQAALVARLGLAMALLWRDAAGRDDGGRWLARPGVEIDDAAWAEIGGGLDRQRVLDGLADTGWIEQRREQIAPGAKLPQLREALNDWARRRAKGKG